MIIEQIRLLVGKYKIPEALDILRNGYGNHPSFSNAIVVLSATFHLNKSQSEFNSADQNDKQIKIFISSVLRLLNDIEEYEKSKPALNSNQVSKSENLKYSLAITSTRYCVSKMLKESFKANQELTISQIYGDIKFKSRKLIVEFLNELHELKFVDKNRKNKTTYWKLTDTGLHFISRFIKLN